MFKNWWKYLFPAAYGLCIYISIRMVTDVIVGSRFWMRPWKLNAIEVGGSVIVGYILVGAMHWMLKRNLQRYHPPMRMGSVTKEFAGVTLWTELICTATVIPLAASTDDGLQWFDVVNIYMIPVLYSLLYYALIRGNAFLRKSYEQQLQIEKISNDQLQTELRFLKAQYHPHFLFNALNTVYFQMDEDVCQAKQTLEELSELLRYQLYDQQQMVSIGQELQYLQSFISLQRIRMNDHLSLTVHFDDALTGQQVYPLLLLPLVENAFKYAGGEYWIRIAATLNNDSLQFHVSNAKPAVAAEGKAGGIGLENLKRRLALLYPGRHTLDINDEQHSFTANLSIQI